ncbi:MAG: alpha/beta hydrolase [Pseudomonadota bacterium]|nr:alpha/beta hydrolase [Pseudomonadota bacterium]
MEEVFFNGVVGRLEGRFHRSESPRAPLVLILHPNPTQGGTMNNRVTYALFQAFVDMGFSVLRFNYRGVGYSQGQVDGTGAGELADAIVALDWLQSQDTEANQCWVVGYSFGAWVAAQVLMRRPEIKGFTFVTPPTGMYDFNFLSPCPSSGLIIQGTRDEVVDENGVAMLAEQLATNPFVDVHYETISHADHLYTKTLKSLYETVVRVIPTIQLRPNKDVKKSASIIPNDDY